MDVRKKLEGRLENLNILFVCGANKGRSIGAQLGAEKYIREGSVTGISVDSGGLKEQEFYDMMTEKGEPGVPKEIENLALGMGMSNVGDYVSKSVTDEMLERADLVLAMDTQVRDNLLKRVKKIGDLHKVQTAKGYLFGTEGKNWENNDVADAQKFEGHYRKLCPYFKEDGKVDMAKIWRDTRDTFSKDAIYEAFGKMLMISGAIGTFSVGKVGTALEAGDNYLMPKTGTFNQDFQYAVPQTFLVMLREG